MQKKKKLCYRYWYLPAMMIKKVLGCINYMVKKLCKSKQEKAIFQTSLHKKIMMHKIDIHLAAIMVKK